ncbi:MAG: poly-beta,6 N-acetyl-D-glucosamine export porin PgaA, partial [Pseudomonadota bacterium]
RQTPGYVRIEMARSYRRLDRLDNAERLARNGMALEPAEPSWSLLLAMVLAEQNRPAEARAVIDARLAQDPNDLEARLASGYVHRLAQAPFAAIADYQQVLAQQPGQPEAAQALRDLWTSLGATTPAAEAMPGPLPLELRADQAAGALRRAIQITPRDPRRRFDAVDAVLLEQEALIREATGQQPQQRAVLIQLQRDRVVALHHRHRWQDAVTQADALRAAGDHVPAYVRLSEASALLALRRPQAALKAYDEALQTSDIDADQRRSAAVGRFYSQSDLGDAEAAIATADALANTEGPWRPGPDGAPPQINRDWLYAQIMAAMARSYAGVNAEAWARLRPLADGAPAIAFLRSDLASVAAARGWPRLADEEVQIAASLAPEDRGIQIAQAESDQRRRRWSQAALRAQELARLYPEDSAVQRLQREIDAHERFELQLQLGRRHENEASVQAPGSGIEASGRLCSPPLAERWRLLGAGERSSASPPEGPVRRYRLGAGLEYQSPDLSATLTAWQNSGTLRREGAAFALGWQPRDGWAFGLEAERFAADTPLRGLLYGITADAAGLSVGYDWHESAAVFAGLRGLDFSDGNRRLSLRLAAMLRVINTPQLDLVLRPDFYASRNSLAGGPYFNPARDRSGSLGITAEQRLSQNYERSLWHALTVSGGSYWQQGYGANAIGSLRYEQRWRHDPRSEIGYGIETDRRVYDGQPERAWLLFANLNHRF